MFDPGSFSITSSTLTICIPVVGELLQLLLLPVIPKNPLPAVPLCFATISSKYVAVLATDEGCHGIEDRISRIFYLTINCLNTLLPLPTAFLKLLVFTIPVLSW